MELYGYFRSSASFRVRIALGVKGKPYDYRAVNLIPGVSEQKSPDYLAINPQGRVPFFVDGDVSISQSPAILEYIEEAYPTPALLPDSRKERAEVRQLCNLIACDIHPLNNLAVLVYLKGQFGASEEVVSDWYGHWIKEGFAVLEKTLADQGGSARYTYGGRLTLADVYLVPQVWNAKRFGVDLSAFPCITAVYDHLLTLDAFDAALPENQPDAPKA